MPTAYLTWLLYCNLFAFWLVIQNTLPFKAVVKDLPWKKLWLALHHFYLISEWFSVKTVSKYFWWNDSPWLCPAQLLKHFSRPPYWTCLELTTLLSRVKSAALSVLSGASCLLHLSIPHIRGPQQEPALPGRSVESEIVYFSLPYCRPLETSQSPFFIPFIVLDYIF